MGLLPPNVVSGRGRESCTHILARARPTKNTISGIRRDFANSRNPVTDDGQKRIVNPAGGAGPRKAHGAPGFRPILISQMFKRHSKTSERKTNPNRSFVGRVLNILKPSELRQLFLRPRISKNDSVNFARINGHAAAGWPAGSTLASQVFFLW